MSKSILTVFCLLILTACSDSKEENQSVSSIKTKSSPIENNPDWIGTWERNEAFAGATLEIKSFKEDSLEFTIMASSGAHMGEIEGVAKNKYNNAFYNFKDEYDDCRISFKLIGDSIIEVDQKSGMCMAGMGVTYSGRYLNKKLLKEGDEKEITLKEKNIFKTKEEEDTFKNLVGEDYKLFINSSQFTSEESDTDSLKAKVFTSGVRGLYTYMENIIMLDSMHNIWAAVIDDEEVYYYTNHQEYKKRLPKTIEKWRERFKEKEVIYKGI